MSERRPTTLKEIAERVGVRTSTASVVLNGAKSGTKVSESTRQAIIDVAKELNYRPNGLARSLRRRRTGIVGYFSGYEYMDPRNPYIAEVMSGMQAACARRGLDLLLYTPHAGHTPEEIVNNLSDGRLDGLIMTARPEHPIVPMLVAAHLPVVAIADRLDGMPCVVADAAEGGRLQARHLHERGHSKVLYLPTDYPFPSVIERHRSFLAESGQLGMEVVEGAAISGHLEHEQIPGAQLRLRDRDVALLKEPGGPTAIQCWDDSPAYRVASQLVDMGFRLPQDIAVAGYNGYIPFVETRWNLTTIRAPWLAVGEAAIDTLFACIEGLEYPPETVLPVQLVIGSTT